MAVHEMLSLGAAILFALALWSGRLYLEGNMLSCCKWQSTLTLSIRRMRNVNSPLTEGL